MVTCGLSACTTPQSSQASANQALDRATQDLKAQLVANARSKFASCAKTHNKLFAGDDHPRPANYGRAFSKFAGKISSSDGKFASCLQGLGAWPDAISDDIAIVIEEENLSSDEWGAISRTNVAVEQNQIEVNFQHDAVRYIDAFYRVRQFLNLPTA